MRSGLKAKLAVEQSNAYKAQVEQIQAELDKIDANPALDDDPKIENLYRELQQAKLNVIQVWKEYRQRNGLADLPSID